MRRLALGFLTGAVLVAAITAQDRTSTNSTQATGATRQPLRVLYAGQPDHPRTQAFVAFLGEHFAKAGTIDLRALTTATAAPWDVVVMDVPAEYPHFREIKLIEGFDRPVVLVGMWPARFAEAAHLKIDDG